MSSQMISIADPDQFAALKAAFADLCEQDAATRAKRLSELHARDAAFAQALADLFAGFDARDLQPPDADLTRLRFGPFRVLRRLGSGGMGEVFLAERTEAGFEQHVALKRVRHTALSGDLTTRFLRERQVLARLQHPGIARLIDGGVSDDGRPWLAMEYVEGLPLPQHARHRGLSLEARIALLRQVNAAVVYAHRNLVIHRDIKPANVLVTPDGEAKLLDFGIAKLLDDSAADATRLDQRAHTLRYAAPEQLTGDRTTTATDIHALGLLLFELMAECPPYARAAAGELDWHRAVLDEPPRPLGDALRERRATFGRALWRRIVGDLDRIVRKALAKNPSERYASVAVFDADLEDWLEARPLRSGIGGARAQTRYLLGRYRWPIAATGGVLLALGIGALLALQQAQRAQEQARAAQARLDTVLRVLGSANPGIFAGRDPSAGDFLVGAAGIVQRETSAGDPELARRALTEIGHALLNLGRAGDAEPVLEAALDAADRDVALGDSVRLGILALLMNAQDTPAGLTRVAAGAARIEALAMQPGVGDAQAVDALARAGGVVSRTGDFVAADRLFSLAEPRLAGITDRSHGVVENYWRQRGLAALRAHNPDVAADALRRARERIEAARAEFSALRQAEGDLLMAQAELVRGNPALARSLLERARPAFYAEYPPPHPERAAFDLRLAWLALAENDASGALRRLRDIDPVFADAPVDLHNDALAAKALAARAHAAAGDCDTARAAQARADAQYTALLRPLPQQREQWREAQASVTRQCPVSPGTSVPGR
jgi:tRNA A-37 threonylcarbamoyl transferase component Bud32